MAAGTPRRRKPPKYSDRILMSVRLPRSLHAALVEATRTTGRSLNSEVEAAVNEWISSKERADQLLAAHQEHEQRIAAVNDALNATVVKLTVAVERLGIENLGLQSKLAATIVEQWDRSRT
jgi:hypothetical protein